MNIEICNIKKLINNTKTSNTAYWLIINSIANAGFGFLYWLIVSRITNPSIIGSGSTLFSSAILIVSISNIGISEAIIKYMPLYDEKKNTLIVTSVSVVTLMTILCSIIFISGIIIWSPVLSSELSKFIPCVIFIFSCIAFSIVSVIDQVFIALNKPKNIFGRTIIYHITRLIVSLLFHNSGFVLYIAACVGVFASLISALFYVVKNIKNVITWPSAYIAKNIAIYALGNYVANILLAAPGLVLPIIVLNMMGSESSAYFYIAWTLSSFLFVIPSSFATSLFAEGSRNIMELDDSYNTTKRESAIFTISAIIISLFTSKYILNLFGCFYVEHSYPLLVILNLSAFLVMYNNLKLVKYRVKRRLDLLIGQSLVVCFITLSLSVLLNKGYGLVGIGIGWIVAQILIAFINVLVEQKKPRRKTC